MNYPAWRFAADLIDNALSELAERAERMPEAVFLAEHHAAMEAPRSVSVDAVGAVLEREFCKRCPQGRDDEEETA